jgi:hypothetical protein
MTIIVASKGPRRRARVGSGGFMAGVIGAKMADRGDGI